MNENIEEKRTQVFFDFSLGGGFIIFFYQLNLQLGAVHKGRPIFG